ncbi:hypothetical protein [Luteibacter sp. ME-Dv--P-043b]|uniref:hypothetical protein n=1 Tax=Luteibacter sp. ME-Dv--P-043b TaxID=3040291 RepID=UPI00255567D7|nr:hypothetical protein [Luteibacter sp. ME-Dv--P-043b]
MSKPNRFPPPISILMAALAVAGFALSFTDSIVLLKVYAAIYVACFAGWLYVINRAGS